MSRHLYVGKKYFVVLFTFSLIGGNSLIDYLPSAQADDDWGTILKPLVKDVLLPGASLGVKKWNERRNKSKTTKKVEDKSSPGWDESSASSEIISPPNENWVNESQDGITPSSENSASDNPELPPSPPSETIMVLSDTPQAQMQVSEQSEGTSLAAVLTPVPPDNLKAQMGQETHSIHLSWSDNAPDETGFKIWIGDSTSGNFKIIHRLPANTTSWAHQHTTFPTKEVYYKIRAFNGKGYSSFSNLVKVGGS